MATTAIWKVKGNLGQVVNYAANPDKTTLTVEDLQGLRDVMDYATQDYKTEEQRYVSGVNCAPEIARDQMMMVKRQFGKKGGIIAFHGYQSFAPGEVTPEQAHEIGVELAQRLWGDRFQVVVATHLDKEHIHNHFVLNSVSFVDGKKYNDCKSTYALMRQTSDQLCREHGLSVIESPEQGRTMSYDTWDAEQKGKPTWYGQIRQDVDVCIARSFLFEHFLTNLKKQGYEVMTGKYIAVRPPGKQRFVRLKTLGRYRCAPDVSGFFQCPSVPLQYPPELDLRFIKKLRNRIPISNGPDVFIETHPARSIHGMLNAIQQGNTMAHHMSKRQKCGKRASVLPVFVVTKFGYIEAAHFLPRTASNFQRSKYLFLPKGVYLNITQIAVSPRSLMMIPLAFWERSANSQHYTFLTLITDTSI